MRSRSAGQAATALALLFAGLAAANPIHEQPRLVARQETTVPSTVEATTTTDPQETASATDAVVSSTDAVVFNTDTAASSATTTAASDGSTSGILESLNAPIVAAAAVQATVSGTARVCSVESVTAFTTTRFITMATTTSPLYTISLKPTLQCTCDDGWGAGIGTSMGTDGLQTVTCQFGDEVNPAVATQTSAMVPNPTYRAEWCQTLDKDDEDKLVDLWENKNITHVLDSYTRGQEEGWWFRLIEKTLIDKGNVKYDGCGVIGSTNCDLNLDCYELVDRGMGAEYWIMTAVESFHSKINVANEYLQNTTIDNILSLDTIAADFSAPESTGMNQLSILASLLSAGIFLAGSLTGIGGVIALEAGLAATAARAAAQGAARAARKAASKESNMARKDVLLENAIKQDTLADTAGKMVDQFGKGTRITGALGAGLWTTASTFTMIGAFSDPEGQIEGSDLTPALHEMFASASGQMVQLGKTAMGRGGDYSSLPAANGSGFAPPLSPESYIAGLFSDGKFLLSDSSQTYEDSIKTSYGKFKTKIVDQALQTGGLHVFALTDLETEEECKSEEFWGGYGAEWMDPLGDGTNYCMQMYRENRGGDCSPLTSCDWVVPEKEIFDKLKNDYQFDIQQYYAAAAQCNQAKLQDNMPDYVKMSLDGAIPACYYNIKSGKAKKYKNCRGRDNLLCDTGFTVTDF